MRKEQRRHQLQRLWHSTEWHGTFNSVKRGGGEVWKDSLPEMWGWGTIFLQQCCFSISCVTIAIMVQPCNSCQSVFTTGRIKFFSPCGLWPQWTPLIYLLLKILLPYLLPRDPQKGTQQMTTKQNNIWSAVLPPHPPVCLRVKGCGTFIFQALNQILMMLNVG